MKEKQQKKQPSETAVFYCRKVGRGSSRGRDVVGSRALSSARCCGIRGSVLRSTYGSKQYPTVLLRQVEEQESYQPHPWKVQLSTHLLLINSCLNVHPFPISTTAAKFHMTEIAQIFQTERQPFFFFFTFLIFFLHNLCEWPQEKEMEQARNEDALAMSECSAAEIVHCSTCCWAPFPEQTMRCQAAKHKNMHPQTASPHKSILLKSLDWECTKLKGSQEETEQRFTALVNFH